jgi:uncharacterized protein YciI
VLRTPRQPPEAELGQQLANGPLVKADLEFALDAILQVPAAPAHDTVSLQLRAALDPSGQRGFLLTDRKEYLRPYHQAVTETRSLLAWLNKHYAAGTFLVSGRKIPRDGGIILAVGSSRDHIEAIVRDDPFCKLGLADVRVIEFRASQKASDIQERIDKA